MGTVGDGVVGLGVDLVESSGEGVAAAVDGVGAVDGVVPQRGVALSCRDDGGEFGLVEDGGGQGQALGVALGCTAPEVSVGDGGG